MCEAKKITVQQHPVMVRPLCSDGQEKSMLAIGEWWHLVRKLPCGEGGRDFKAATGNLTGCVHEHTAPATQAETLVNNPV